MNERFGVGESGKRENGGGGYVKGAERLPCICKGIIKEEEY